MDARDVCSKVVVFRERLQAIRFRTLDAGRSAHIHSSYLNPALPSTVSPPCVSTRALSNVARSKTSSGNPLLGNQRGDRNQVDGNGRELGDVSLVDKIYRKSCTRTAAAINNRSAKRQRSTAKIENKRPTSPVCDLSCSSSLHGLLYNLSQLEKVQWYFFFAFFTNEPFTRTNSDFCFEFRSVCGDSTSDSGSCQETSLRSWFDSDAESCKSKLSEVAPFFRFPRTVVVVVRDMK